MRTFPAIIASSCLLFSLQSSQAQTGADSSNFDASPGATEAAGRNADSFRQEGEPGTPSVDSRSDDPTYSTVGRTGLQTAETAGGNESMVAPSAADSLDKAGETSRELSTIVVRAQRAKTMSSDIIDGAIIAQPRNSKTAEGLLADLAGIDLGRTSPAAGKGTGVKIRGLDESRSLILLNGRPLNGAGVMGGDYVDWSMLPATDITSIEVIRGAQSAEYGNTIGGVINIITKHDMTAPTNTKINASYGIISPEEANDASENGSADVAVVHHSNILNTAALDLFAGYGREKPYLRNNYFERMSFGGDFSVMLPFEIKAGAGFLNTAYTRGFAVANSPTASNWDPDYPESLENGGGGPPLSWKGGNFYYGDRSYWKNTRTQIDFSLQKHFSDLILTAMAHINDQNRTEYFYAITDTNKLVLERFAKPEDYTWGCNFIAKQNIEKKHVVKYGVEGTSMRYSNSDVRQCDTSYFKAKPVDGDLNEPVRAADRFGVFIQSNLAFGGRLKFTPGIRYDYYVGAKFDTIVPRTALQGASPNAGVTVTIWRGGKATLQGAYAYRFPTCPELYWFYGGYKFADRKDLSPERATQAELGISQTGSIADELSGSVGVRGYYYRVNDYIRTIFGYQPSRLVYNIDLVTLAGLECDVSVDLWKRIGFHANYTYQKTEKTGDTHDSSMVITTGLPELPKHKANVGIEYTTPRGASAGLSMRFVGQKNIITGNVAKGKAAKLEHLDAFAIVRLQASYPLWEKSGCAAKLKMGVDNLFDVAYKEIPGIPMPGITPMGAVEVAF